MASSHTIERHRGFKEAGQQLAVLRERWPLAFPIKSDVRPLAVDAAGEIAAAMGWSLPYTLGVLAPWKMAAVYCRAVLAHDQRIALDGTPVEPVDARAKDSATQRLAQFAARSGVKQPAPAKPKQATKPVPPPKKKTQVRVGLLGGRA
jgi:sRNA-binding protein